VTVVADDRELGGSAPFPDVEEAVRVLERLRAEAGDEATREVLTRVAATMEALRQRAEAAEAESLRDALTGLANRRAWQEALDTETERARRDGRAAAVVVDDVDDFKAYNDEHGHLAGDLLLRRVAQTLEAVSRTNDVVARVGGDEFAVIAVGAGDGLAVGRRIEGALEQAGITASIGLARADPGSDLADAWNTADRAMYVEKVRRHGTARAR
jgi:diguanylate cyclase (GGDEF)-like protein